jgi:hypothetical protein
MADGCERFEIDIEQRAHGALGADEGQALEGHLASCERCRGFARLVTETEARLKSAGDEAARAAQWPAIERSLAEQTRRMKRSAWLVPTALLGAAAATFALGLPLGGALVMAAGALVTTAAAHFLRARWLRALAQAEASREGLVDFYRKQVRADLRAVRVAAVALTGLALVQVLAIELMGHPSAGTRVAVLAGASLLLGTAAVLGLRQEPRLRREREELQ